ncbi:MAG: DUF4382 domain-containing protein [Candidatus Aenigmatarchaeota archaeon]
MKIAHIAIILVLIIVALAILFYPVKPKSTLIIAVKDVPRNFELGNITSLKLNFSEVSVHRALGDEQINTSTDEMSSIESNETQEAGWFVVVDETQTVDLLQFTNVSKILGQNDLDPGKYTQIRLKIDSGSVTIDNVTYDLIVPSKVLKLNRGFFLEEGTTLKLTLDFNVEKSLVRSNNMFKLKPVVAIISEKL